MADYALESDSLRVTIWEYHYDGGIKTHDAGLLPDSGLGNVWRDANAWCLTSAQFSMEDDCVTHDRGLQVRNRCTDRCLMVARA
jgi:hypothetical protein